MFHIIRPTRYSEKSYEKPLKVIRSIAYTEKAYGRSYWVESPPVFRMYQVILTINSLEKSFDSSTGERPYPCPKCAESFRLLKQFKNHVCTRTVENLPVF